MFPLYPPTPRLKQSQLPLQQLRDLAACLEIPDCDCPVEDEDAPGGCPHTHPLSPTEWAELLAGVYYTALGRLRATHGLAEWAELLAAVYPDEYADPPPASDAACVLTSEARVEVYRQRRRAGLGLWHDGDLWRDEDVRLGVAVGRARNGSDFQRGLCHD